MRLQSAWRCLMRLIDWLIPYPKAVSIMLVLSIIFVVVLIIYAVIDALED